MSTDWCTILVSAEMGVLDRCRAEPESSDGAGSEVTERVQPGATSDPNESSPTKSTMPALSIHDTSQPLPYCETGLAP